MDKSGLDGIGGLMLTIEQLKQDQRDLELQRDQLIAQLNQVLGALKYNQDLQEKIDKEQQNG